jgi:hypothetical protein
MASTSAITYVISNYNFEDGMLSQAEQARMDAYHETVMRSTSIVNLSLRGTAPGPPMTFQECWEHLQGTCDDSIIAYCAAISGRNCGPKLRMHDIQHALHTGGSHPEEAVFRGMREGNRKLLSTRHHDPTCYNTFGNGRSSPSFISLYGGGYSTTFSLNGTFCTARVLFVQEGRVRLFHSSSNCNVPAGQHKASQHTARNFGPKLRGQTVTS